MNKITLDFKNHLICSVDGQQQTVTVFRNSNKIKLIDYLPKDLPIERYDSFTWNFEQEIISCNQDTKKRERDGIVKYSFDPEIIRPMEGLKKKLPEFLKAIGLEK